MKKDEPSINKRLAELIKVLNVSKNKFGRDVGLSSTMVSKITTTDVNFGVEIVLKIVYAYPDVNLDWLLKGEGEIFKRSPADIPKVSHRVKYVPLNDILNFVRISKIDSDLYGSYEYFLELSSTMDILEEMIEDLYIKYHQTLVVKLSMVKPIKNTKQHFELFRNENTHLIEDVKQIGKAFKEMTDSLEVISEKYFAFNPTKDEEDGEYVLKKQNRK